MRTTMRTLAGIVFAMCLIRPSLADPPVRRDHADVHGHRHGQMHRFRGHDIRRGRDGHGHHRWHDGHWHHRWDADRRDGRPHMRGYFYPAPVYAYRDFYQPPALTVRPAPYQYWYYCASPAGYYPYVPRCRVPWRAVPATP